VIMAVAFIAVAIILARSLFMWAQGNLSPTSRTAGAALGPGPQPATTPVPAYAAAAPRRQP
jgi:hypothetical protein